MRNHVFFSRLAPVVLEHQGSLYKNLLNHENERKKSVSINLLWVYYFNFNFNFNFNEKHVVFI
jgi:hypothetical protein